MCVHTYRSSNAVRNRTNGTYPPATIWITFLLFASMYAFHCDWVLTDNTLHDTCFCSLPSVRGHERISANHKKPCQWPWDSLEDIPRPLLPCTPHVDKMFVSNRYGVSLTGRPPIEKDGVQWFSTLCRLSRQYASHKWRTMALIL